MNRKSVIIIALLAFMLLLPLLALAAPVGKFTSIEGNVDVTPPGKEAIKVNLGDPVNVGDIIRTKSKAKCEVAFLDGTILRLAENSRLRVSEFSQDQGQRNATLNLFRGKIQNIVATVAGAAAEKSKYEIRTPTSVCGVRGTQFFAYYQAGVSGAVVTEGTVYAFSVNRPGEVRTVGAGQAMIVTNANTPPTVRTATTNETEQHQKDTKPADKPKSEGKDEEKKSEALAGKSDDSKPGGGQKTETKTEEKAADTAATTSAAAATTPSTSSITGAAGADSALSSMALLPVMETPAAVVSAPPPSAPPPPTIPIVPPTPEATPEITALAVPNPVTNATTATFSFETNVPAASFRYSLDGAAYVPTAGSTISLPALPDGLHTINVQAVSPSGPASTTATYTWTVDTVLPVLDPAATTPPPSVSNSSSTSLSIATSKPVTFLYSTDGVTYQPVTGTTINLTGVAKAIAALKTVSATNIVTTLNIIGISDGSHKLYLKAVDAAGNVTATPYVFNLTVDTSPPAITLSNTPASFSNATSVGIGVSATDTTAVTYVYKLDNNPVASPSLTGLANGAHTFSVTATDVAGNSSTKSYSWTVDTAAPVITLSGTPAAITNASTASITVSASKPVTYAYTLNGAAVSSPALTGLPAGSNTFSVTATDAAGNQATQTYTWTTDYTAPVITLSGTPAVVTNANIASITVSASKPATYTYSLNGAAVSSPALTGLPAGSNTFSVTATDAAGNQSTKTYTWTTDYTAPVITLSGTPAALTNASTASITVSASKPVTYAYILNGAPVSSPALTGLPAGSNTFSVTATDAAGNQSTTTYIWTTDYTAPVITLSGTPAAITNANTANITVSASKPATYTYSLNGAPVSSPNLTGLPAGSNTFSVPATDAAGNQSTQIYTWTTDYTVPLLSIAAQSAMPAAGGLTEAKFTLASNKPSMTYTSAQVIDTATSSATGTVTVTGNAVNVSGLPSGTYTLTAQGTDAAGNPATQSMTFTLNNHPLTGAFFGSLGNVTGSLTGGAAGILGQGWGGWDVKMTGTGNLTPTLAWTLSAGGANGGSANNFSYWLDLAPGTSDLTAQTLTGTSQMTYLSTTTLGTGQGLVTGTFDGLGNYQIRDTGKGTFSEQTLSFISAFPADFIDSTTHPALLGGTASLWTSTTTAPAGVTILGHYNPASSNLHTWNAEIASYNYTNATNTTYDGGAYKAFLAGVDIPVTGSPLGQQTLEGLFAGIYMDNNGQVGLLKVPSHLTGTIYANIGMAGMSGGIYTVPMTMPSPLSIIPSTLTASLFFGSGPGSLAGAFDTGGSFASLSSGSLNLVDLSLIDTANTNPAPWGVYKFTDNGSYSFTVTPTSWTGKMGGSSAFGAFFPTGGTTAAADNGYWLAQVNDGSWNGNRLGGTLAGSFITDTKLGTMTGDLLGTFTNPVVSTTSFGSWQAASVGSWTGTPLSFVSDVSASLATSYGYNGAYGIRTTVTDGLLGQALLGGTDSLWTSTLAAPVNVSILGLYSPTSGVPHTWNTLISSYNFKDASATTYDGGAYAGYLAGLDLPTAGSSSGERTLEGLLTGIYVDGSGKTGLLKVPGHLAGSAYSNIGFEMNGTLYAGDALTTLFAVTPANVTYYTTSPTSGQKAMISAVLGADGSFASGNAGLLDTIALKDSTNLQSASAPWGIFRMTDSGVYTLPSTNTPPTTWTWTAQLGGQSVFGAVQNSDRVLTNDTGFWWATITDGNWDSNRLAGTLAGTFITPNKLGTMNGDLLGTYTDPATSSGTWQSVALGSWEGQSLAFSGNIDYDYIPPPGSPPAYGLYNVNVDGTIVGKGNTYGGLVGGTQAPWTGATSLSLMGPYSDTGANATPYLWDAPLYSYNGNNSTYTTYDGGAFWGLTGGVWKDGAIDAKIYSLYIDPAGNAGILTGSLAGSYSPALGMLKADGTWTPTVLDISLAPTLLGLRSLTPYPDWYFSTSASSAGTFSAGGSINGASNARSLKYSIPTAAPTWGIWQTLATGGYTGASSDTWNLSLDYVDATSSIVGIRGTYTQGTQWSNNKLAGTTVGYGADIANATTWISVGDTIGTFNPTTWQAVQIGAWMETNKFLAMQGGATTDADANAALKALNIPAVQVGKVDLAGSAYVGGNGMSVTMPNTVFFAYSTGAAPRIWATGNVNGTFVGNPLPNDSLTLTGSNYQNASNMSATFTVKSWNNATNGKWGATVTGSGNVNASPVALTGGAAGKVTTSSNFVGTGLPYSTGNFSGTAAGIAR